LKPGPHRPAAAALALALAATLLALFLSACGGGSATSSAAKAAAGEPTTAPAAERRQAGRGHRTPHNQAARIVVVPHSKVAPLRVSGGGSGQFRVQGGDNSIQEYGAEADRSELVQAAEAAHGYLLARAERDWARACGYLSGRQTAQLQQLASSSPQLKGRGCAAILAALLAEASASALREAAAVDAASLRAEGRQAFLLYHGTGDTGYFVPMTKEGAAWKVAAVEPSPLG
jgi:hypothetical protein